MLPYHGRADEYTLGQRLQGWKTTCGPLQNTVSIVERQANKPQPLDPVNCQERLRQLAARPFFLRPCLVTRKASHRLTRAKKGEREKKAQAEQHPPAFTGETSSLAAPTSMVLPLGGAAGSSPMSSAFRLTTW